MRNGQLELYIEWWRGRYYVIIDSIARMIPGVLGNDNSNVDDSFSNSTLEYPHYTRLKGRKYLCTRCIIKWESSGNKMARNQALEETKIKRSDLLKKSFHKFTASYIICF